MAVAQQRSSGLLAGAASTDITPEVGTDLSGYAARQAPASGVHDQLTASALAVSDGDATSLLIVADLVALDPEQAEHVRHELHRLAGIQPAHVAVSVSHTHSGPAVTRSGIGGVADQSYVRGMLDALIRVGSQALRALEPALLARGTGHLTGVSSNRRGGSETDPLVPVVRIRRPDGTGIATVFSHACHPVALGPDNLLVTADWPGFARAAISRFADGVPVFLQGCCGQLNTGHAATTDGTRGTQPQDERTFAAAERLGTEVATAVRSALRASVAVEPAGHPSVAVVTEDVDLPLDLPGPPDQDRPTLTVPVSAHRWGNVRLLFLPGEPFVEFALELRQALADPELPVIGYTGGVPGYLPYPPAHYLAGGYEVTDAHFWYGQPAAFAPAAGERVRRVAERLGRQVSPDA